jgi:hypothetical protein
VNNRGIIKVRMEPKYIKMWWKNEFSVDSKTSMRLFSTLCHRISSIVLFSENHANEKKECWNGQSSWTWNAKQKGCHLVQCPLLKYNSMIDAIWNQN